MNKMTVLWQYDISINLEIFDFPKSNDLITINKLVD